MYNYLEYLLHIQPKFDKVFFLIILVLKQVDIKINSIQEKLCNKNFDFFTKLVIYILRKRFAKT